jgi:histidinol-phosphate phosphatase family protein
MMNLNIIDRSWTLFLDRDGVINEERLGKYVLNWQEFLFTDGTLNALAILSQKFGRLIIVSNQRGVGKGLMTEDDLKHIHNEMQKKIEAAGGRIDKIFYCTETDDNCFNRKPNPGMALQAFKEFPDIDPAKSIIIGNKPSDMLFGRSAGMYTVFVTTTNPAQSFPHPDIDFIFPSLSEFAMAIKS